MANNEYETIKRITENKQLLEELEKTSPGLKAQAAGYMMSFWLPRGVTRKILMVIIVLVAVGYQYYLLLLLLPFFSPRIAGEVLNFYGTWKNNTNRRK